jgi:Trypsin-like peptidase domain
VQLATPASADLPQIDQSVIIHCGDLKGTGFFLPSGVIITARHVVEKCASIYFLINSGDSGAGKVLYISKEDDIAVISQLSMSVPKGLKSTDIHSVTDGQQVTIVGSPIDGLVLSQGTIADSKPTYQPRSFSLSIPADHGSSGGPVFSSRGIVGIVVEKMNDGSIIALNSTVINLAVASALARIPAPQATDSKKQIEILIQDNSAPKFQLSLVLNIVLSLVIFFLIFIRKKRFFSRKVVISMSREPVTTKLEMEK